MQKKIIMGILLIVAIFTFSSLVSGATVSHTDKKISEINDGSQLGAGSDYPLLSPMESNYVWVTSSEPMKATWTIYDPSVHYVTTISHSLAVKYQQGSDWYFADRAVFTFPAFAQKGKWLASCEFELADGTRFSGVSAENPNSIFLGIQCSDSGDPLSNFFIYPWYLFGHKMPAMFWIPGFFIWIWPVIVLFAMLFNRAFPTIVDSFRSMTDTARKSVRGKKSSKKKSFLKR